MNHLCLSMTLLAVLCSNYSQNQVLASEVYRHIMTANSSDFCTVQPCLTLSQFAAQNVYHSSNRIRLIFLPGTHYLSKINLTLSNMDSFVMKSEKSTAQIKCTDDSHIHFSVLLVEFSYITINGRCTVGRI